MLRGDLLVQIDKTIRFQGEESKTLRSQDSPSSSFLLHSADGVSVLEQTRSVAGKHGPRSELRRCPLGQLCWGPDSPRPAVGAWLCGEGDYQGAHLCTPYSWEQG